MSMSLIESMQHANTNSSNHQHERQYEPNKNVLVTPYAGTYSEGMTVHERLAQLMKDHNISQNQLAAKTKVPQPTIQRILSGESRDPRHSTLEKIARFFKVNVSELRGDPPAGYHESQPITRSDRGDIRIAAGEGAVVHYTNREMLFKDLIRQLDHNEVTQLIHMLVDSLNERNG